MPSIPDPFLPSTTTIMSLGNRQHIPKAIKELMITVTFGFQRNPDVAGNGRSEGWKRVRPIAIDYRTVAGTAGAGCKGD